MKVIYDDETDTLTLIFNDGKISESDEIKEGMILDYDDQGKVVSMELLDASAQVKDPKFISYELKEIKQAM
ncbi:MAG: DUF2283 domain-containing protein [Candidatus Acidulodesulfobacterium ferriphilum]|jgi:uncharacterized protein YuzE|uniref:DUF2283 domain-containing protein n=1 Tax=Candidatus Acidulodesulfobacterium ferriphilum TaxID=2597223 RepID=A0A519BC20_9DELT|nr:DUF2283 domain-containing protein [Deltaproteobacteria bacterium]RZD14774.1 MAG: DUF2283 domain-containing protein [Candidatus Acidulodesulfobacterium ferriphilum]